MLVLFVTHMMTYQLVLLFSHIIETAGSFVLGSIVFKFAVYILLLLTKIAFI